jgi:Zn-dependent protease
VTGGSSTTQTLLVVLLSVPIVVVALTLHELAHGVTALLLGDRTAKDAGRITLDPRPHIDPVGAAAFLFTALVLSFPFGWARQTPVNEYRFKHPARGMALVALAGPAANFLLATLVAVFYVHDWYPHTELGVRVLSAALKVNIALGVFNLLPVPPLDGSRIVGAFLSREQWQRWREFDQYGPLVLIVLFLVFRGPTTVLLQSAYDQISQAIFRVVG